uniref:Reverse transcriptase domain-containing protein n=1 Tax=Latimeria chalumnae TaxID=7897 RepID=H3A4I6_LATCH
VIGTWDVRTLCATGKLEQATHELTRYQWDIVGIAEARLAGMGETTTDEGHQLFYSGEHQKHEYGVALLVNRNIKDAVLGWNPVSSRMITLRLAAQPFNLTIIQVYAPMSTHDDEEIEDFYHQLEDQMSKIPKKNITIVQGDWNALVGMDAYNDWKGIVGRFANNTTNDRGLRLLEFAQNNNLILANTLFPHKKSQRWTWHSPDGNTHNQVDYILIINTAGMRSFPGADNGSDHDLLLMTMKLKLKRVQKSKKQLIKYDVEKLEDLAVESAFKVRIGERFTPLLLLDNNAQDMVQNFTTIINNIAEEILGKKRTKRKPWIIDKILKLCDKRRELKPGKGNSDYKAINSEIRKEIRLAKEKWLANQCKEIETSLHSNNGKKAFQIVNRLIKKPMPIEDKNGNIITKVEEAAKRWTEYCKDLYNYQLMVNQENINFDYICDHKDDLPILRSEVEEAIKSLKIGKAVGIDNIPAELLKHGEVIIDVMSKICNKICENWIKSIIITLPKKGNLRQCQNYRTISLISHPSKVFLRILHNTMKSLAESLIAEEQAGFRAGRNTMEQIFNLRILVEKHLEHQKPVFHNFIDFKKAFDRVWQKALWVTMWKYNFGTKLINIIEALYENSKSAVLTNGILGEWFPTTVSVRQGCLLSPTLFNIFLEHIMTEALDGFEGSIKVGGRLITNLQFADDIDLLGGTEEELQEITS